MPKIPKILLSHFRTNHAGETGAIYIYKGILSVTKHKDIIKFSNEHLKTELTHLMKIEKIMPKQNISKLIFLWKILGFFTGYFPALIGKKFVYATIFAVESFVEIHYQNQIDMLSNEQKYSTIRNFIKDLLHDEVKHKEEAVSKIEKLSIVHKIWGSIVRIGSITAVKISKII